MSTHRYAVPAALRRYVVSVASYDERTPPDAIHRGLPSTTLTLIVAFDDPLDCGWPDGTGRARYDTLVAGLHTRPSIIRTHGIQRGIQLSLTPLGARALLGVPAAAFAEAIADGDDGHRLPSGLQRRLQDAEPARRSDLLEEFLLRRLTEPRVSAELTRAWDVIGASGGTVRVDDVAREVGWSRRHLLSRFRAEFGVGPKEVGRLARFERALALVRAGWPLADVAHLTGYADQSHLHREWRSLAGTTPRHSTATFTTGDPALDG